jgi:hypothetical protein
MSCIGDYAAIPAAVDRAKTMRIHHSQRRKASILSLQALEKLESTSSYRVVCKLEV